MSNTFKQTRTNMLFLVATAVEAELQADNKILSSCPASFTFCYKKVKYFGIQLQLNMRSKKEKVDRKDFDWQAQGYLVGERVTQSDIFFPLSRNLILLLC